MTQFDPTTLADRIIRERKLEEIHVTWTHNRLRFSPSMVGDATYISDQVRALRKDQQEALAVQFDGRPGPMQQAAYRAMHIDPTRYEDSFVTEHKASAELGLVIAERMGVNVPV
jgi:hypothetical protein